MSKKKNPRREFWRTTHLFVENAVTNNIVLIQALGLCPIIAAGTTLQNGVALTVCTAVVLIPLSLFIALAGNWLPKWLRPAIYVLLASLLLVGTSYVMDRYVSTKLFADLHLFIPLMAVNMLYTRSVGFSSIVNPVATVVDALGSTVGFGGDAAMKPQNYLIDEWYITLGADMYLRFNDVDKSIKAYDAVTENALEPYVALRNAYLSQRRSLQEKFSAFDASR